jgi:hypothetical protein
MTPKEKAKELTDKYYNVGDQEFDYSKEFALIAVYLALEFCGGKDMNEEFDKVLYLVEVKNELEKL